MHAVFKATFAALAICVSLGCTRTVVVHESYAGGEAGEPGWQTLGYRTVHGRNDHDIIKVSSSEQFRSLRFVVRGSALEMYNVVVVFRNGARFSPDTRLVFAKGEESRVIDLPGDARNIKEIRFHYGNLPRGGRARVSVYAR